MPSWSGEALRDTLHQTRLNGVLAGDGVKVAVELVRVEHRRSGKRGDGLFARNEGPSAQRDQSSDRCTVAGDREGFAAFDSTHDRGELVEKFTLGDLPGSTL